jgi:hypothetical protein
MRTLLICSRRKHVPGAIALDEALVVDSRAFLRPAQLVERKLMFLLKNVYMPISHARVTTLVKGRELFLATSAQPAHRTFCAPSASPGRYSHEERVAQVCNDLDAD